MSDTDAPPAKRARTDEDASETPITRSKIWYKDGSVVLQASSTQFRVHFGVLAEHSTVFKDMYELPQPDDSGLTVEGCPLVQLDDDPAELRRLLLVLYNPLKLSEAISFSYVAALVRLGRKYAFTALLKAGVQRILEDYPSNLAHFDALKDKPPPHILWYHGLEFDILALCQEMGIRTVLPYVYYRILTYPREEWVMGSKRPSGTIAMLSRENLRVCLLGDYLVTRTQLQPDYTLGWLLTPPTPSCRTSTKCMQDRCKTHRWLMRIEPDAICGLLPRTLDDWIKRQCEACKTELKPLLQSGREKAWTNLPSFFELPPWNELTNDV
ncbi:hypothetical protein HMN09_01021600 [Mycena chlorophos]|uniref:BTB domain-containing protein n=1 Tax=Mycena chlorophos TaxID=658473 RepID=A0A8H6W008_MYCCL|nr:hypothetical protein HMN09_01021600 [Mycena chlorophos]